MFTLSDEFFFFEIGVRGFHDSNHVIYRQIAAETGVGKYNADSLTVGCGQIVDRFVEDMDGSIIDCNQIENGFKKCTFSGTVLSYNTGNPAFREGERTVKGKVFIIIV